LKKEILSKFYEHIRKEVQTLYLPEHLGYTQSISGTFAVRKKVLSVTKAFISPDLRKRK